MKEKRINVLMTLFVEMFQISAFTFGGGFVIATFIKKQFVDRLKWIDETEMLDLIALGQSSPGAVAVNIAILTGWRVFGFLGMLVAVFATILPPILIITVISFFYAAFASNATVALLLEGMRTGVAAVILSVSFELVMGVLKEKSLFKEMMLIVVFIAAYWFKVNTIALIAMAMVLGIVASIYQRRIA